jgi:hypothetical protein
VCWAASQKGAGRTDVRPRGRPVSS